MSEESLDYEEQEEEDVVVDCSNLLINKTLLISPNLTSWLLSDLFTFWTPLHHIYFQLGNLLLLIYFLLLAASPQKNVRLVVAILYSVCMILWGFLVIKSIDLVAWNVAMVLVNLAGLNFNNTRLDKEMEIVYAKLFEPLHVNRSQFNTILQCKRNTRVLHPGEHYSMEKSTRVDSLALLLSGRLLVSQQGRPLHIILPHQFVDSPEYFGVSTDELFQVTITSIEESKLLVWHRDKLRLTIMADEFLRIIFDHIIGRDVVRKLIQVSDSVSLTNGYYSNSTNKRMVAETEPMLIDNTFDTNEIWSLTKIAEEETPV